MLVKYCKYFSFFKGTVVTLPGATPELISDDAYSGGKHSALNVLKNECDVNSGLSNLWATPTDLVNPGFVFRRDCLIPISTFMLKNSRNADSNNR